MGFGDVSRGSRIAFALAVGVFLTDIVGFPTPCWVSDTSTHLGLFEECTTHGCDTIPSDEVPGWAKAVVAMEILGFLACLGCLVLMVLYVCVKNDEEILNTVATGLAFAAAAFILVGVIIVGAERLGATFGWSFVMTTLGGLFHICVGFFNIMSVRASACQLV